MTKKYIISMLAALAVSTSAIAQQPAAAAPMTTTGLLGQRYGAISYGVEKARHTGLVDETYNSGISVNFPVRKGLDLSASFVHSETDIQTIEMYGENLMVDATAYTTYRWVKPFLGAGFGYNRSEIEFTSFQDKEDYVLWAVNAGVEIPFRGFVFTPKASYKDAFHDQVDGHFTYGVEANRWFNEKFAGYVSATFIDFTNSRAESWAYVVGVRMAF